MKINTGLKMETHFSTHQLEKNGKQSRVRPNQAKQGFHRN